MVTVLGVVVTIENLTIEDGRPQVRAGSGLTNEQGTLTLRDVIVRRNQARRACIFNTGTLTMSGASRIADNRGLGVYNGGSLTMNGASSIIANDRMGVHLKGGRLTMNGHSSIRDNGVGVHAAVGTIVMNDRSSIRGSDSGGRCPPRRPGLPHHERHQHDH